MSTPSIDQFITSFHTMDKSDKLPEMKSILTEGKFDFARSIIYALDEPNLAENRTITFQASIEIGRIHFALEIIGVFTEQQEREQAISIAIENEQLELVEAILLSGPISGTAFENALNFAASCGQNELIELLLSKGARISQAQRDYAFDKAIDTENLPLLQLLIGSGPVSQLTHGKNVVVACQKGNLPILQTLLSMGPVVERFAFDALKTLIESENEAIFDFLLLSLGSISEEIRGEVVAYAASFNHLEMAQKVLETGTILEPQRGAALEYAASKGNIDLVNLLFANGSVSQACHKNALIKAASSGHLAIIERLLEDATDISEAIRSEAVYAALLQSHMPCFNYLMNSGSISQQQRASCIFHASRQGNHPALITLLSSGSISDIDRGHAIRLAISNHHPELFLPLITSGAISNDDRDQILRHATESGEIAIVQALFTTGPISALARAVSMNQAIIRGRFDILEFILAQSSDLSLEHRGTLVMSAAEWSRLAMVQLLLESGPISQESRVSAMNLTYPDQLAIRSLLFNGMFFTAATPPRLRVSPCILQDTPCVYLEDIGSNGLRSIRFLNPDGTEQPGIDAGGLTKQFIHQLIHALQEKAVLKLNDFRIPTWAESATVERWELIGKLLSEIERKNIGKVDPIYTGQIFDKATLSLLKAILDDSKTEKQKMMIVASAQLDASSAPLVEFLNKQEPTAADIATIKEALIYVYGFLEEDDEPTLEELQDLCLTPFKDSSYKALRALAAGLSGSLKDNIVSHGETYAPVLLGPALPTAEVICAKLSYTGVDEGVMQKVDWIKAKIAFEHANPESTWITQFLTCVTGQPVCPSGSITIRGIEEHVCKAHTCFNILDLPISNEAPHIEGDFTDEVRFIKNLEILMSSTSHDAT